MIKITTLPNGIKLVYENMPFVKSVSVGAWIAAGSFYETKKFHGISHFIEHMLFKGTLSRSAADIAHEMDYIGGSLNAFTARDCTCFYTKTLAENLDTALSLLSDMIVNSLFAKKDIATEASVVKEEIDMYEDNPEELVHDITADICYPNHPFGQNILGTHETVSSFNKELIKEYMNVRYRAENIVISIAGNINESHIAEKTAEYFGSIPAGGADKFTHDIPTFNTCSLIKHKPVEQANLVVAFEGLPNKSADMYALLLVCNILGGGMSSRLFQSIREEKGLAYSVYTYPNVYAHAGYTTIYAGCAAENFETVKNLIFEEVDKLRTRGITEEEFLRNKNQLKGSCVLSNETVGSRMSTHGKQLLLKGKIDSDDDIISKIDGITDESVRRVLRLFNPDKASLCAVMP